MAKNKRVMLTINAWCDEKNIESVLRRALLAIENGKEKYRWRDRGKKNFLIINMDKSE